MATRFYDENNILEITMRDPKTNEDFSADFFDDATNANNYDETLEAYKVEDVDYLVDYAENYIAGNNPDFDYPDDYDPEEDPLAELDYVVEPREKDLVILELAASLFDAGWRAADKEQIKRDYDMPDSDAERICQRLAYYAKH
ncbi:hypothetical protein [Acidaminococcus sp. HCP3S3_G9_1]|uniref:hypothetical protein n=1 Tax=Acidaminococcus sp. HCP3S3_G9_1 TaxID=3438732 RepID=UPI003F8E41B0